MTSRPCVDGQAVSFSHPLPWKRVVAQDLFVTVVDGDGVELLRVDLGSEKVRESIEVADWIVRTMNASGGPT